MHTSQLLGGLLIGVGRRLQLALGLAFLMNITFVMAGRVNPSAFYLVMQLVLVFAIADSALGVNPRTPPRCPRQTSSRRWVPCCR